MPKDFPNLDELWVLDVDSVYRWTKESGRAHKLDLADFEIPDWW